jgi:predicted outer membrane repeat protein
MIGSGAGLLAVNGNGLGAVLTVGFGDTAQIENITIKGGNSFGAAFAFSGGNGGGIVNDGTLALTNSNISGNIGKFGGGIYNAGNLTVNNCTISGNSALSSSSVIFGGGGTGGGIASNGTLTLNNSTVSGNSAISAPSNGGGFDGGLFVNGMAMITGSTISGNTAAGGIGGIGNTGTLTITQSTISGNSTPGAYGGISTSGACAITYSTISHNYTPKNGGGMESSGGTLTLGTSTVTGNVSRKYGGGIYASGAVAITNSTVSGNYAYDGDAGLLSSVALTLTNSTVSGNFSRYGNAGVIGAGTLTVTNSTISGNSSEYAAGGIASYGALTLTDSTISGNTGAFGAGVTIAYSYHSTAKTTLNGSIIAANYGQDIVGAGASLSGSNDFIGDGSDDGVLTNSVRGTPALPLDPMLSPLENLGGPTQTMAPLAGSAAIGAGANFPVLDANNNDITATDQRGVARPQGSEFDIGAYEVLRSSLIVNTLSDLGLQPTGTVSLREAIASALSTRGSNTITFAAGLTGAIDLASPLPALDGNITVDGPGASLLTINGQSHGSVFTIDAGATAEIEGLTMTGGTGTTQYLTGVSGGGVLNLGTLTITNSVITGNSASGYGGGIFSTGMLTVLDSTISANVSSPAGGILNFGAVLAVANSTITGNIGAGIFTYDGQLTVTDSTISGNSKGGLYLDQSTQSLVDGTIIAGNTGGDIPNEGSVLSGSHDLIGDGSDGGVLTSSLRGTTANPLNPLLSPLGNFGGPTPTMALLAGSPAINVGANFNNFATDQRGFARPTTSGIDIGADQGALFPGDSNFDGTVNLTDLLTVLNNYGQSGKGWTDGDFNFDGTVNLTDLLALLNNYGQSAKDNSIALTPAASAIRYKAISTPFISTPLPLNWAGATSGGMDGEILEADSSVL